MQKFFIKSEQINEDKIKILGTDVNHIINVLRLNKNSQIQVCDEDTSQNYIVEVLEYDKEIIVCKILEKINATVESNVNITVYQGLPKADKMELIIQKTTEIGVKKIIPVEMQRSIVKLTSKDECKKIDRWQKISEVAAKQSKRDIIPKIENVQKIDKICDDISEYDLFIVAYEDEDKNTLKEVLKKNNVAKNIAVLIGPEGGIDSQEIQKLKQSGAIVVTLGKRILRTETAPIVISSNIIYELEN